MLQVLDFFSGCGGTSAGLASAGMDVLCGVDWDPRALETYAANIDGSTAITADIRTLTVSELSKLVNIPSKGLLISACAPCQPFSKQNAKVYDNEDDERVDLIAELKRFVQEFTPDYILLENVPGLESHPKSPYSRFKAFLSTLGYDCNDGILNAADYGVPQLRRRLVMIASQHGIVPLPQPTHGKDRLPHVSVDDAIGHFPPIGAGEKHPSIANHASAKLSSRNVKRIKATPEGGDWRDWPVELRLACHADVSGYTDTYGRMNSKEPARTLTTRCISYSNGRFGHPLQNRAISGREAAALQSFPDDFAFAGSLNETARQVGNAVPVLFAAALGEAVSQHWEAHCG